jgi:hypothetical protein
MALLIRGAGFGLLFRRLPIRRTHHRHITLALALLLLGAATRVELVDEVYTIPPAEWRYVQVQLRQTPVAVNCNFQVISKDAQVRVALLNRGDLERLRADQPHGFLAATQPASEGTLYYRLQRAGEYAVVVDNRALHTPVRVHLKVALDFSGGPEPAVRTLSPQRRLAVILISFAIFFGIVTWSARKLLRAAKQ